MIVLLMFALSIPAEAIDIEPPDVPHIGEKYMPDNIESFGEGLWYVIRSGIYAFFPEMKQTASTCLTIVASVIVVGILKHFPGNSNQIIHLASSLMIGVVLLNPASKLIQVALETVLQLTDYGKLLLPVLTGALAAQGGVTTSSSLYVTTMFFVSVLSTLIKNLVVPMIYVYMCLIILNSAFHEEILLNLKTFLKWLIGWSLKTVLYIFTGFMGITGVVSGTADAAAVKAVKLTISGMVPVVGGIISDASESILIGVSTMKNAAGIYGILAIFAVAVGPFVKIGAQYLMLKFTGFVCSVFSEKQESELIKDFSGGMGMILGMAGAVCLMLLISVVSFMKGVS